MMNSKFFLFLLFLLSVSFSQSFLSGWEGIAYGAVMIAIVWSLLAYMFGRAFNIQFLLQAGKTELIFAFSTVFLIFVLQFLAGPFSDALYKLSEALLESTYSQSSAFSQTTYPNFILADLIAAKTPMDASGQRLAPHVIDIAKMYMEPVAVCARDILDAIYIASIPTEAAASVFMEIFMSEHASGFGFKILSDRLKNVASSMGFYIYAYYIILHILNFIRVYGLFFMSVGVVLRAFPPTRGVGAYMLGFTLGLYFVFPFAFVLSSSVAATYTFEGSSLKVDSSGKNLACALPSLPDATLVCSATDPTLVVDAKRYIDANKETLFDFLDFNLNVISAMAIRICLLPFVAMIITFSFILSSTNLFGGIIPEVGRGLVKFI